MQPNLAILAESCTFENRVDAREINKMLYKWFSQRYYLTTAKHLRNIYFACNQGLGENDANFWVQI